MFCPSRMAWIAAASTTAGTGVSHTPCARLMPPMRSHSVVMARISDCSVLGASALSARRDSVAVTCVILPGKGKILPSHFTFWGSHFGGQIVARARRRSQTRRRRSIVQEESMHELSIAASIVEAVTESASAYPGARVKEVRLRVGALASVVEDSLQFCWELASADSPVAGAKLVINKLPV